MNHSPHPLADQIKTLARDLGFDLVGIACPQPSPRAAEYRQWIAENKHGAMDYLAKNLDHRLDLTAKLPWAKSIICVAIAYYQPDPTQDSGPGTKDSAKIARYAWGRDYHKVIESKLKNLEKQIRQLLSPEGESPIEFRAYTDTGPLLERELAHLAGLGWIGKHTLLIHPKHGSFFLLGELITSLELPPDSPETDHCGTCTRCIEACPTDAITPYSVDATKCISYLTLEDRGTIPPQFHAPMKAANFIIGCDICQDVCPFNRNPLSATEPDFTPRSPAPVISLPQIEHWSEQDWDIQTRGRAFRRAKFQMWQRNADILSKST